LQHITLCRQAIAGTETGQNDDLCFSYPENL
jgi:hypothetical protein